ncbi:unnamed protein product [Symbiodinium natans]|uniref:Transmembrane protein n=1 Tax=Symbiodinium natans TaxID=878477 RepID=A0A812PX35_9DINO|nr:unnamed protein product [Symbiodinium natans]
MLHGQNCVSAWAVLTAVLIGSFQVFPPWRSGEKPKEPKRMRKRMSENGSRVSKESGGRAAVNRLPPLALSSVLSIAVILGLRRAWRREDNLWASFLTGVLITAAPAAVVASVWFVKCLVDICTGSRTASKKRA